MLLLPLWKTETDDPEWKMYSIANKESACPVSIALNQIIQNGNNNSHVMAILSLIEKVSSHEQGPKLYEGTPVCHEAVAGEGIYEFRKGDLRLYWFYGQPRKVIICPHIFTKHVRKTPKAVARKLIQLRDEYQNAHEQSDINFGGN